IPARAARTCAPSPPSRNLPAKTTSTPARRCCILYSWAEPPQFVLVLAGTQFNLSEAWLFFAFQPCFTYSANLDSNESKPLGVHTANPQRLVAFGSRNRPSRRSQAP